jgi:SAM-dependent methyltransferase
MGITLNNAALLLQAKQAGAKFDRILTIGRLRLYISPKALQRLANQHGVEFDRRLWSEGDYAETFFKVFLGSSEVDSLDYNQYEGCRILHDMNEPVAIDFHERYDAVIDGGSLEHVFNFPVAIANCMNMVKPLGRLFVFTMCNNHAGHGFYQFSPELFFRLLDLTRGFEVCDLILEKHPFPSNELTHNRHCYSVTDPARLGCRVGLVSSSPVVMMVHARRLATKPIYVTYPIQSDYALAYTHTEVEPDRNDHRGLSGCLLETLKKIVRALPRGLRNHALGFYELRQYSFSNRRFYRRWRPF